MDDPDPALHQRRDEPVQGRLPGHGHAPLHPRRRHAEVHARRRQAQRPGRRRPRRHAPHLLRDAGQLVVRRLLQERGHRAGPGTCSPASTAWTRSACGPPSSRTTRAICRRDDEAAGYWRTETDIDPDHILPFGRKDNFWEMARYRPVRAEQRDPLRPRPRSLRQAGCAGPRLRGQRRLRALHRNLEPGLHPVQPPRRRRARTAARQARRHRAWASSGWSRCCRASTPTTAPTSSGPSSRRRRQLTGHTDAEREANIVAYRVIADHVRAVTFLIGDGVHAGQRGPGLRPAHGPATRRPLWTHARLHRALYGRTGRDRRPGDGPRLPGTARAHRFHQGHDHRRGRSASSAPSTRALRAWTTIIADVEGRRHRPSSPATMPSSCTTRWACPSRSPATSCANRACSVDEEGYHVAREEQRARGRAAGDFQMETDDTRLLYPMLLDWAKIGVRPGVGLRSL